MEDNTHYIEKEHKEYASKATGNAGLTTGIIGTALGALNTMANGTSLLGGVSNSNSKNNMTTQDYVDITKEYYKQRLSDMKELTQTFYNQDQKINNTYVSQRDGFDLLSARISELEKKEAVNAATQPLMQQILQMLINGVNSGAMSAVALENERMKCRTNTLANYCNGMFQPVQIQDPSYGTTGSPRIPYNPFGCTCTQF